MLLEHKPNVNALDKDGYTALAIACKEGYYDIALALINSGAYINVQVFKHQIKLVYEYCTNSISENSIQHKRDTQWSVMIDAL